MVDRPYAPPDHSDPAARAAPDPRAPLQVGARVAWVRRDAARASRYPAGVDHLGTVTAVTGHLVTLNLDTGGTVTRPGTEVYPRPGQ